MLKKICLYLFISALSFTKSTLATELMIPEEFQYFSKSVYNNLPSVEEADTQLRQNGYLHAFLDEVKPMIEEVPNLIQYFGFRLLHKHGEVEENKRMVESKGQINGGREAFITTSLDTEKVIKAYPSSWVMLKKGYSVFEYSTDENVEAGLRIIAQSPKIIEQVGSIIEKYDLRSLLAPALLAREKFLTVDENNLFVEVTYLTPTFASIVTPEKSNTLDLPSLIKTSWGFESENQYGRICKPETICIPSGSGANRHHKTAYNHRIITWQ